MLFRTKPLKTVVKYVGRNLIRDGTTTVGHVGILHVCERASAPNDAWTDGVGCPLGGLSVHRSDPVHTYGTDQWTHFYD